MLQSALVATALVGVARTASAQEAEPPAVVVMPPPPPAETRVAPASVEKPPIGGRGRVVIDLAGFGGASAGLTGFGTLGGFAGPVYFSSIDGSYIVGLAPSADVFVTERLSLGARVSVGWTKVGPFGDFSAGGAPRIGYALPISSSFAFWPRLGVGADFGGLGQTYFADADAGFVMRVSKHLLVDLGPVVTVRRTYLDVTELTSVDARARVALRLDF